MTSNASHLAGIEASLRALAQDDSADPSHRARRPGQLHAWGRACPERATEWIEPEDDLDLAFDAVAAFRPIFLADLASRPLRAGGGPERLGQIIAATAAAAGAQRRI